MSISVTYLCHLLFFFFFQAEDGIRDVAVTGVQTCALPICPSSFVRRRTSLLSASNVLARPSPASSSNRRWSSRFCRVASSRVPASARSRCTCSRRIRSEATSPSRVLRWSLSSLTSASSDASFPPKCERATSHAKAAPRTSPMTTSVGSGTAPDGAPVAADALEAAGSADDGIAPVEAVPGHPLVAEREIELHRIGGIDRGELPRDLLGHPPVARASARQADRSADVLNVGVHRHQESRWRHRGPEAEVRRLPAHHPAQEEVEALARAANGGQWEEMAVAARDLPAGEHFT